MLLERIELKKSVRLDSTPFECFLSSEVAPILGNDLTDRLIREINDMVERSTMFGDIQDFENSDIEECLFVMTTNKLENFKEDFEENIRERIEEESTIYLDLHDDPKWSKGYDEGKREMEAEVKNAVKNLSKEKEASFKEGLAEGLHRSYELPD